MSVSAVNFVVDAMNASIMCLASEAGTSQRVDASRSLAEVASEKVRGTKKTTSARPSKTAPSGLLCDAGRLFDKLVNCFSAWLGER